MARYDEVLDDPAVDAVYIPLPISLHLEWALKSDPKKKRILLKKPPALSVEELDMIIEVCYTNDLQLMDCTMWIHHPRTHKMKRLPEKTDLFGNFKSVSIQSRLILKKLGLKQYEGFVWYFFPFYVLRI